MQNKSNLIPWIILAFAIIAGGILWKSFSNNEPAAINPAAINFEESGNLVRNNPGLPPGVWHLVYEEPGQPALTVKLSFDEESRCFENSSEFACQSANIQQGINVSVTGFKDNVSVAVRELRINQAPADTTRTINLYYYNPDRDQGPGGVQCSSNGLVTVERIIPRTITPIQDAISLLLRGEVTAEEKSAGITTEYPLSGVSLKSASLNNGVLTLEINDPENKTVGGSCRVGILWKQIEATAKQFPEVTSVRFIPEELFQP